MCVCSVNVNICVCDFFFSTSYIIAIILNLLCWKDCIYQRNVLPELFSLNYYVLSKLLWQGKRSYRSHAECHELHSRAEASWTWSFSCLQRWKNQHWRWIFWGMWHLIIVIVAINMSFVRNRFWWLTRCRLLKIYA